MVKLTTKSKCQYDVQGGGTKTKNDEDGEEDHIDAFINMRKLSQKTETIAMVILIEEEK